MNVVHGWVARACALAGGAGALANVLLVAYLLLQFARPGSAATALGPLAAVSAGVSAALLVPVAVALGSGAVAALGVVAAAGLAAIWWLLAGGALAPVGAAAAALPAALLLAAWLVLVCREETVPPRAARFGRRVGAVAFAGTLVAGLALAMAPPGPLRLACLVLGGVPGALAWLAMPAWPVRIGLWLRRRPRPIPVRSRAVAP